jgi:transposase InsO family protein
LAGFPRLEELPWNNAVAESFFGTLKTELIHPRVFATRDLAKVVVVDVHFFGARSLPDKQRKALSSIASITFLRKSQLYAFPMIQVSLA